MAKKSVSFRLSEDSLAMVDAIEEVLVRKANEMNLPVAPKFSKSEILERCILEYHNHMVKGNKQLDFK
ncbi:TPA: hypothetical protein ACQUHF_005623 [Bacillus paranthracis]|uniref:hypothetical protein n=1 Tax=Bacillus cereus group TaxID=86661 RepID=UPI0022E2D5B5|nr:MULTISPECIES: hypothetical protein [Bacillus cereus group]MDA2141825.1 hypothetical protein [Bacillus cereus group sp. Bc256]MDH2890447.1 hypothetical protein [Bacillus cytotoxicus]